MKSSDPLQCWSPAKFSEIPKIIGKCMFFYKEKPYKYPNFAWLRLGYHFWRNQDNSFASYFYLCSEKQTLIDYFNGKNHMKIIFNTHFGRGELFEIYCTIYYSIYAIGLMTKFSFYRWKKNSKVWTVYLSICLKY